MSDAHRRPEDTEFCIHCGATVAQRRHHTWLCEEHWRLVVQVWGRTDDGERTCRLCVLDDGHDPGIGDEDTDAHLARVHGVESHFDYIRERERLLGLPSPMRRGTNVDADDQYEDDLAQTGLEAFA